MRAIILILTLLTVTACGRPLTEQEKLYLSAIHGEDLDTSKMRLVDGHFAGEMTYKIPVRPRTTCQERIWPPLQQETEVTVAPAATVIFNKVLIREDIFREDFLKGYPHEIDLLDAMLFAHEATHVWQWQNRKRTGYTPLKALTEHVASRDPYLFDPDNTTTFLDYGYEQQGSIVEEYVCCRLLDPEAPRTARLRALIHEEMPIDRLDAILDGPQVRVPWQGIQTSGICE
jgi:hypothetical protein